jgi:sugar phosphate isomerase/epimerase
VAGATARVATVRTEERDMATPVGEDPLIASHYTLSGAPVGQPSRFSFAERVAAAADAGFVGLGLLVDDYASMRDAGISDAELRAILDDHGLRVLELEFLFDWTLDGGRGREAAAREATLHEMADLFTPDHLNVGDLNAPGEGPPIDVVVERFGAVCDRAAEHDARVALEFLPWTAIPDLRAAWDIVRGAARPNAGVLVDAWHYFRGNPDAELLASLPAGHVVAVQLGDADAEPVGPLFEDAMFRRRLPGEGAFDLTSLIRTLDRVGVAAPYSVEIMSSEEQARPVRDAATRAYRAARAVLNEARATRPG